MPSDSSIVSELVIRYYERHPAHIQPVKWLNTRIIINGRKYISIAKNIQESNVAEKLEPDGYKIKGKRRIFYGWWIVVLGSVLSAVGTGIMYHSFTVFFLPIKRDLAVSAATVSLLYGATRLEGGAEGPIIGRLIDRFGPRPLIIGGALFAGIGFVVLSTVQSFLAFFIIYVFVISLGYNAGFFHPVSTALNSWFIRRRSIAFAIMSAAGSAGGIIMAPVLSYLILNFGWRTGALVSGIILLIVGLPAALPMHRSPEAKGLHPDGEQTNRNVSRVSGGRLAPGSDFSVRQALRTRDYWLLTICISLRLTVTVALAAHLIPILVWKGVSEATAAYFVSVFAFTTVVTTLGMGWMGDRWNKSVLSALGTLATIAGMMGLVFSQGTVALYFFPVGLAITMGTTPLNWSLIGDLFGRRSYASLRGFMGLTYGIGTFFSPIYAGWIFDSAGSYVLVLITFSVILLITAGLFILLGFRSPPPARSTIH